MKLIVILIITGFIFYTFFFLIRTEIFLKKSQKEKNNIKPVNKKDKKLIVAIPVLREQNCIEDTVM